MGIGKAFVELIKAFFTSFRTHTKLWALIVVAFLLAMVGGWQYANSPAFCGSCHNMDPYFESWKADAHYDADVSCVDCHLPPGFWNHVKYKMIDGAISGVFFITGKGPSKPSAHVYMASCMHCHEAQLDEIGTVAFEVDAHNKMHPKVEFDHSAHLTDLVAGINPECTTCHYATTQDAHLEVTKEICASCHHRLGPESDCSLCHDPGVKEFDGMPFDHADLQGACYSCHHEVGSPTMTMPCNNCLRCHSEPEILNKDEISPEEMHATHVSDRELSHKVTCSDCHGPALPVQLPEHATFFHRYHVEDSEQNCDDCHTSESRPSCDDCH